MEFNLQSKSRWFWSIFKCDNKPNTLVIIKSTNGNVFGGYTEQSWSGIGCEADSNAFIFSFINKVSHDFQIADKSNTNTDSNSYLGNYYTHLKYEYGLTEARSFLAGSSSFQVDEVFTKQ